MNNLNNIIASLQSKIDHLETELTVVHDMLVKVGFENGLETVKATMNEVIEAGLPFIQ
ncbi:MAG: hypothetical protein SP1CHLAM54_06230 [Chlamydiia bacterium]|nr:hypothetical protein [Chlamydiia bacterium]MCH9615533.1 hypothetical protein [Chlamydiia bacterium]MCH9629188.1 hypothetical protein [Chlamydiia bacterium]